VERDSVESGAGQSGTWVDDYNRKVLNLTRDEYFWRGIICSRSTRRRRRAAWDILSDTEIFFFSKDHEFTTICDDFLNHEQIRTGT
jgi:hypothetical protein